MKVVLPEIHVAPDGQFARAAAIEIASAIQAVVERRGVCRLCLAGGGTPLPIYRALAAHPDVPWPSVELYWGDERAVPASDPDSNYAAIRLALIDQLPVAAKAVHPIPTDVAPAVAATRYAALLSEQPLDILLLGMGGDGHTASLFPDTRESGTALVMATTSPKPPHERISLTTRAINAARAVYLLVAGAGKAAPLAAVHEQIARGAATLPAARVQPTSGALVWILDKDAAGQLAKRPKGTTEGGTMTKSQFGMIGMAVMGRNLAFNLLDHGISVAAYNLEQEMTDSAVAETGGKLHGTQSLEELVAALERPRKIMMMIKAGKPVDIVAGKLQPLLEPGDTVIDGGNSWYEDTRRREKMYAAAGLHFFGVGVSGGEDGARHGPAMMPGGDAKAYEAIQPIFEAIAAKTDSGPCVAYLGPDGAGHFVKMVHNGIEYADMQFIAEAYEMLAVLGGLGPAQLAEVFDQWNQGPLESFLIKITAEIFQTRDSKGDGFLIDQVLDKAGQKGTGRWTARVAIEHGVPIPSIVAAIDARVLSSMKSERLAASQVLHGPRFTYDGDVDALVSLVHDALYAAKIVAYAQGMNLIAQLSRVHDWPVQLREVARIWKGGCIIRARFLDTIMSAYERNAELPNLLLDEALRDAVQTRQVAWREAVGLAQRAGVPVGGMASGLAYFDSYRSANLPQNLTQAQRDAFGSHTYQRKDDADGPFVHTDWLR